VLEQVTRTSRGRGRIARACLAGAIAVAALLVLPSEGPLAWLDFAIASAGTAVVLALIPDGTAWGAAALFALVAAKDGLGVVDSASVGVYHVVAAALAVVLIARFFRKRPLRLPRLSPLEWALGGPFLAGLWSLPASLVPGLTATYTARLLLLWVVAVMVARTLRTEGTRRNALIGLVAGGVAISFVAVAQWVWHRPAFGHFVVHGNAFDGTLIVRPAGFYLDPNFLGMYLVLASLAAFALAFGGGRRALLWLLPTVPLLGVIAITYSRSSWVSLVVGVVMLVPLVPKKARLSLAGVLAVAVVLAVALVGPASLATRVTSVFELEPDSSSATRLLMTESTLEMIADRPVSGTGLEAFAEAYPSYAKPGARLDVTHPHQVPLALVAETGIAGLVVQIALLAATVAALRRVWRSGLSPVNAAVISGMAALLVGVFLQFFLYFEPLWLMTGLLAAAALDAGVDSHPAAGAA